jgi:NAD(P)-dependent dehydrogenase (short-subunit alcohol dehydrogenase family)
VLVVAADMGDADAVAAAVTAVQERFGEINGVVHGAGVSADEFFGLTHDMKRSACDEHFRAKVLGLAAVAHAVDLDRLDFCVTLSSLATVLGAIGHGPYAAANAALDGLVGALAAEGHRRVLTVNWDSWQNSGEKDTLGGAATVARYQMSYEEGCAALERALTALGGVHHLVNSTGDIEPRLAEWVTGTEDAGGSEERHPRPALATPFVAPADEIEETVAEAWQDVMGLLEVGVLDNFFELGGHSLMAVQVIGRIRKALGLNVPLAALAECPTVRQLADKVRELQVQPTGGEE